MDDYSGSFRGSALMDWVVDWFIDLAAFLVYMVADPFVSVFLAVFEPFYSIIGAFGQILVSIIDFIDVILGLVSWLPIYVSVPLILLVGLTIVVIIVAIITKIVGTLALQGWFR